MKPSLSVLMAVCNDKKYLRYSVNSILEQTYTDFEFVIIDDGSSEDIESIVKEFSDPRILFKRIKNRGLAGALNYGLELCSGKWIARMDSDDLSVPERFEVQMNYLRKHPHVDVLGSSSVYFDDSGKILFELIPPEDDQRIKELLDLHNPVNHSSVIFSKDKIINAGGYDEKFGVYEDFELWFRLKDELNFRILKDILVFTRYRKDSMTGKGSKLKVRDMLRKNAFSKLETNADPESSEYWNNILFWIEYFYGNKDEARKNFKGISVKRSIAYLNTFLPEEEFRKLIELRVKLRLKTKAKNKSLHKQQLKKLITK